MPDIRSRQLAALAEIGQHALAQRDLGAILREAAERLRDLLDAACIEIVEERLSGRVVRVRAGEPERSTPPELVTAPIGVADRPWGIVYVHARRILSRDDGNFLQAVANVLGTAVDAITRDERERARAEEALSESRFFLEQAQEVGQIGSWVSPLGSEEELIWSQSCYQIFGVAPGTRVTVAAFFALVHPEDRDRVRVAVQRAVADRVPYNVDHRIVRPDGALRWVRERADVVQGEGGTRLIGVVQDVTDRKVAESALRESEARFRAIFEEGLDGVFIADDAGRCVEVNPAGVALVGRSREAMIGLTPADVSLPASRELARELWAKLLREGELRGEWTFLRPDGTTRLGEFAARAHLVPGRHLVCVRDVTERRQLEEQFRQAQKMEAIGRLAGGVAHDFNNVLTVIQGYCDLLVASLPKASPAREDAAEIQKASARAAALVQQLLAFSRKQVLEPRVVNLNVVLADLQRMLARLVSEDVELQLVLAPDLGNVRADPGQIQQVVMNLVVNARDAMPRGGALTIVTDERRLDPGAAAAHGLPAGDYVRVAVRDAGTGMAPDTLAHVFEPFFTTKGEGKGTGLGLSTSYGIVKQSGGNVTVESELGRGTTFTIWLPRVEEPAVTPPPPADVRGRVDGSEVVLLVEDDDAVRRLSATLLLGMGYRLLEAANGDEALRIVADRERRIDLLFTDVVMPRMSGRELALRARALRPELRVLYASGYTADAIAEHGFLEPGTNVLAKPFDPASLGRRVREVLDQGPPSGGVKSE